MISDKFNLSGKTALVSGCKRGIGKAIAFYLAEAGADIIGVSSTLNENDKIAQEVQNLGRKFTAYSCDFGSRKEIYAFLEKVGSSFKKIDILVNNAGITFRKPAAEHSDELWDKVVDIDMTAHFIISREIGRKMIQQGNGKIIFTASLLSFQGGILCPGYAAAKGGIVQLAKALSNEWASNNIQVNCIAPGYIDTELTEALHNDQVRYNEILKRIPAGHWGKPEDIAGAALFLSSSLSDYVTGTVITVDGGWMAR